MSRARLQGWAPADLVGAEAVEIGEDVLVPSDIAVEDEIDLVPASVTWRKGRITHVYPNPETDGVRVAYESGGGELVRRVRRVSSQLAKPAAPAPSDAQRRGSRSQPAQPAAHDPQNPLSASRAK